MGKKGISSAVWTDCPPFPVNLRLFTLQRGVLGDYFSYQTYLLITRQGCSLLETHAALSSLLRGGVVQQQLDRGGLDSLDELPLIALSSCRSSVCNGVHVIHDRIHHRNNWTSAADRALNPCCSGRIKLFTRTGITASTNEGSCESPKHNK